MTKVYIGVDPHRLSATIELVDHHETVLATGRFATGNPGYAAMRKHVAAWPDRVWAVEGCSGTGRPLAQRLLADGEHVVGVPAKLSPRARLFDTGHDRKTDAHDAHAVAVVAARTKSLRVLAEDGDLEALRLVVERGRRTCSAANADCQRAPAPAIAGGALSSGNRSVSMLLASIGHSFANDRQGA